MNNPYIHLTLLFGLIILQGCSKKNELTHIEGFAQGTTYHISFDLQKNAEKKIIEEEIHAELNRLDKEISNYRDDSRIEKFNAQLNTEPQHVSEEIVSLIEIARNVSKSSNGCYDLTIKPLFDLWGFKKDTFNLPKDDTLQQTLTLIGMEKLVTLDNSRLQKTLANLRVDLSSIGQGYSVSRIANILEAHQITNYLVEIGGELSIKGKKLDGKAWRIALEKPLPEQRKLEKIVEFTSGKKMSLMTSGTYRHYFDNNGKRYSHILDARNGKPVAHNTVSVSVLHENASMADAWSTALLCLGSKEGLAIAEKYKIAALYIDQEGDKLMETKTAKLDQLTDIKLETVKGL